MARRRTRSDIPLAPQLSQGIINDPEDFGNYITSCIEAIEQYGVPPQVESRDGTPSPYHCIDAILDRVASSTPVIITNYTGREKQVINAINTRGEFVTSLPRAFYHLYARNSKIPHERQMCNNGRSRLKHINCMSKVLDLWKTANTPQVTQDQIIQSSDAILASSKCAHGSVSVSCMAKAMRENQDSRFIAQFLSISNIDLTKNCELRVRESTPMPCIQQVYEGETPYIGLAFDLLIENPEVRELLKYPIFITPFHPVPVTGYQYLIERLQMGDSRDRIIKYFTPRVGLMKVRFTDEDPYRTGDVFTNPLDYVMRAYATEDPEYARILGVSQGDRSKILDVLFSNPDVAESVSKPFCRAAGEMVPCIDAVISSNVAPGTIGQETMKSMAFNSINLAEARCFSPTGTISCLEKAIRYPGNFKYVKNAISNGATNLTNTRCGSTTCLDMVISETARANVASKLGESMHKASQKASSKPKQEIETLYEVNRAEAFEQASNLAYANSGSMGNVDEKERTELMNIAIKSNAKDLASISCRNLGMDGSVGGKPAEQFAAEWSTKKITDESLVQRMETIQKSLEPSNSVNCLQRVLQIASIDPDTISKSTLESVIYNPDVDLNIGGCRDEDIDKSTTCLHTSIQVAKKYGLNQWRMSKMSFERASGESKRIRRFFEAVPSTDSEKDIADEYVNKIIDSKELKDLLRPMCISKDGSLTSCLAAVLETKHGTGLPPSSTFKFIASKSFDAIKDQVVKIAGVERTLASLICRDSARGVMEMDDYLYKLKQSPSGPIVPGMEGPAAEGSAIEYYGRCHGCKDDETLDSRKCFDDICWDGMIEDDFKNTISEYRRDGTLYTNGRDILGISGVYKMKEPGQTDFAGSSKYISSVRAIERKVASVLENPDNYPVLRTKYKGKNVIVAFRGFSYPTPEKVFEKDITVMFSYISEEADDTLGKSLQDSELPISQITGQKQLGKLISNNVDLVREIDKAVKSKPSKKDTFLTVVISTRAADILKASTCQNWTSCLSLSGGYHSGGMVPNSLALPFIKDIGGYISYIASNEFSPKWHARALIAPVDPRKSNDADYPPKTAPCAYVTPAYGIDKYKTMLLSAISEIFYQRGINSGRCPNQFRGSKIIGYDDADDRMNRVFSETKKNCIDYHYNLEIEKIMQGYENAFNMPMPPSDRDEMISKRRGKLREDAQAKCNIRARGRTGAPVLTAGPDSRKPISDEYIQFVPRGGLATLSYYPYFDTHTIGSDSDVSMRGGLPHMPITDAVHSDLIQRYGDGFVVRLREVAYN